MEALFQHRNTDSGVAIAALVPSPSALFIQAASAPADLAGEDAPRFTGCAPAASSSARDLFLTAASSPQRGAIAPYMRPLATHRRRVLNRRRMEAPYRLRMESA